MAAGTLTVTAPVAGQWRLKDTTWIASGTYTGTPGTVEVSTDGGSNWSTIAASPAGGNWSGTFTLSYAATDTTVQFRFSADHSVTASVTVATVYYVVAVLEQSNGSGRGTNSQTPYAPNSGISLHKKKTASGYAAMSDPTGTEGSSAGSYALVAITVAGDVLAKRLGLVNFAVGGTTLANWQKGAGTGYYEAAAAGCTAVGGCSVVLAGPCESDAIAGTSQSTYHTQGAQLVSDWRADFPSCIFVWRTLQHIATGSASQANQDAVNAAILQLIADTTGVYAGADVRGIDVTVQGGELYHFLTDQMVQTVGGMTGAAVVKALTPAGGGSAVFNPLAGGIIRGL